LARSQAYKAGNHAKWAETFRSYGYSCWLVRHRGRAVETDIGDALQIDFGNILLI
jgi:hypothetical protein